MTQEEMAVKLTEVDARSKSNTHRLNKIEEDFDALNKMAAAMEVMANEQKHQSEAVTEIKTDVTALGQKVDAIEKKPGKRWDNIVWEVLKWAILLLLGIAAVKAGLA